MKKIVGKKRFDHGDELSLLLQQMAKSVDHIRGNHLWFYFQSVIPRVSRHIAPIRYLFEYMVFVSDADFSRFKNTFSSI